MLSALLNKRVIGLCRRNVYVYSLYFACDELPSHSVRILLIYFKSLSQLSDLHEYAHTG